MKKSNKSWYSKVVGVIRRECPPEHYIALNPDNPRYFAVDKDLSKAIVKLRDKGYSGTPLIHYQLDPNKRYIFQESNLVGLTEVKQ
jgi:hypothetical protein